MSQAGIINTSGSLPPTVATQYTADNATTATPAANNLNLFTGAVTDNDTDGIRSIASGSTVTTQLTNRFYNTTTSAAATVDLITFSLGGSAAVYRFDFQVAGRDTATGNAVGWTVFGSFKTNGAASTLIQTAFVDADKDAALSTIDIDMVQSGNSAVLRVSNPTAQTIAYAVVGHYVVV